MEPSASERSQALGPPPYLHPYPGSFGHDVHLILTLNDVARPSSRRMLDLAGASEPPQLVARSCFFIRPSPNRSSAAEKSPPSSLLSRAVQVIGVKVAVGRIAVVAVRRVAAVDLDLIARMMIATARVALN